MRPFHAFALAGVFIALGSSDLVGQQGQVLTITSGSGGTTVKASGASGADAMKVLAQTFGDPQAFKHTAVGPNITAVLKAKKEYSQFLAMAERAGVLPLLSGTVHDTTYAAVTFRESVDSGQNPFSSAGGLSIPAGQVPSGVNMTDMKEGIANSMDSIFTEAKKYALAQEGLLTVFAPTNAAFAAMPKQQREQLLHDSTALVTFVRAHIVTKGVYAQGLPMIKTLRSLSGSTLPVTNTAGGEMNVGGVAVTGAEVVAGNGVIHGLAGVLPWPTTPEAPAAPAAP